MSDCGNCDKTRLAATNYNFGSTALKTNDYGLPRATLGLII